MDGPFNIPVTYKGIEREFEATLQVFGYTHKFQVDVEGTPVIFERDEEGRYRAIIMPEYRGRLPENELLHTIALAIEQILS
jgi:hypothetical protein